MKHNRHYVTFVNAYTGVGLRRKGSKFVENIANHFNSHTTAIFQPTPNLPLKPLPVTSTQYPSTFAPVVSTINHIRINWQKFTLQSFGSENDLNYPHFLPIYSEESVKTCIGFIGSFTGTPHWISQNHEKTVKTYKLTSKDYVNKRSIGFLCIFTLSKPTVTPHFLTVFTEKSRKIPQFQSVFYLFVPIFNHL